VREGGEGWETRQHATLWTVGPRPPVSMPRSGLTSRHHHRLHSEAADGDENGDDGGGGGGVRLPYEGVLNPVGLDLGEESGVGGGGRNVAVKTQEEGPTRPRDLVVYYR
jgi:hypothetical protein